MHYTDCLPPEQLLGEFPNWKYDCGKEGRPGCHEGTLWCCREQDKIDDDVGFSAGDVYLADGSMALALIGISDSLDFADELRVYSKERFWRVELVGRKTLERIPGTWQPSSYRGDLLVSMEDSSIFPLQYHTHLVSTETGSTISGCIQTGGKDEAWDPSDLWG